MYPEDRPTISEELFARAIGREVLNYVKDYDLHRMARQVNTEALLLLKEILDILDDASLDDPECFYQVERLVHAFHSRGLLTTRHCELV